MKYRYLKNHRAASVIAVADLSTLTLTKPSFATKAEYRAWCADANTDHCFYSMAEGDSPNGRISEDNPINKLHGFVADFDAPVDWPNIDSVLKIRCDGGHMPTWRTKTQSGYIRLVWEFDKPMPIAPALAESFMKRLSDALKASMLLAGFDKTSLKPSQYFEIGEDWTQIGDPIHVSFARTVLLKAANDTPIRTEDTNIPLDDIAAEVARRFPNRWKGEFVIGYRGPLFWIDDGIDRDGCQVREDGMICYSDRAGTGFKSWASILGKQFVTKYEEKKLYNLLDQ